MKTLIPLYASLMAALTFGVHADVGSYMLEALTNKLIEVSRVCCRMRSSVHNFTEIAIDRLSMRVIMP